MEELLLPRVASTLSPSRENSQISGSPRLIDFNRYDTDGVIDMNIGIQTADRDRSVLMKQEYVPDPIL